MTNLSAGIINGLLTKRKEGIKMSIETLVLEPLKGMMDTVLFSFIPTLFIALLILGVGWLMVRFLRDKVIVYFLELIEFDKIADKMGIKAVLKSGGIRRSPSAVVGCLVYCVMMVMVLILTVQALGFHFAAGLIDSMLGYIPSVIIGALVLIIGMYLARFVSVLVYIAAKHTDMPAPAMLSRLSKLVIMIYVAILYLKEIGFVALFEGVHYTIFIGGVVFALALAFGLAGKDVASHYLHVFDVKKSAK